MNETHHYAGSANPSLANNIAERLSTRVCCAILDRLPDGELHAEIEESVHGHPRPAMESCIEGGKFIVRTDLPGIDPKNVEIRWSAASSR